MNTNKSLSNFTLFKGCCQWRYQESEIVVSGTKEIFNLKKQNKISLKKNNYPSLQNNSSFQSKRKNEFQIDNPLRLTQINSKQSPFLKVQRFSTPTNGILYYKQPMLQNKSELTSRSKCPFQNKNYFSKTNAQNNHLQLEKTAKRVSNKKIKAEMFNWNNQNDMKKTKLNKKKYISNLSQLKDSIISYNVNDQRQNRLQQSIIVINYFNPGEQKEEQIVNLLSLRQ